MNITVLDDYQDTVRTLACFAKLAGHRVTIWNDPCRDIDRLASRLAETEALALLRERTPVGALLLERLGKLRIISQTSVYPHIDVVACTRRGVILSSDTSPARPSYSTAELTWGLILAAMRRIPQEAAALKAGKWQQSSVGLGLRGRTVGIYGFGRIGSVVAGYARAFGSRVLVWGREASVSKAREGGYAAATSRAAFFEEADVLTLHIRLIPETRGIITAADLARMKPTSLLVNTSRAGLIESGALEVALRNGRPAMAAVDVYEDEPVVGGRHPLLAMDNVVCTPHLGYVERDTLESMYSTIFDQILAYAAGHPINVVNPEALQ